MIANFPWYCNPKKHSSVLVKGGKAKHLSSVRYHILRGTLDAVGLNLHYMTICSTKNAAGKRTLFFSFSYKELTQYKKLQLFILHYSPYSSLRMKEMEGSTITRFL